MIRKYLSLVKFAHTLFAMPFALIGFFAASLTHAQGLSWKLLGLVVLCMVFARNAAMAFNRYIDRSYDEKNARTAIREIPAGIITPRSALLFVVLNCALFILCTAFINFLCLCLSPVALAVILGYSLTKRFTALCHLVLGIGLGLAPVGAWLAITGTFAWPPVILGFAVLTWVSGFDIIYALQDEDFDRNQGLHSIPAALGRQNALQVSNLLHLISGSLILLFGWMTGGQWLFWAGAVIFCCLLIYQHLVVKPNDLSRVNLAFFTTNGIASLTFSAFVIADLFLKSAAA